MITQARCYEKLDNNKVHCYLCAHHCRIAPQKTGICGVRFNSKGDLLTSTYSRVAAQNIDPVEKKPLYHILPGSKAYSIGTFGCNFNCDFCQNWQLSQPQKNKPLTAEDSLISSSPERVVKDAVEKGCTCIAYTYTEPTLFFEYVVDLSQEAHKVGLFNLFITNGYITPQALESLRPSLDACNVDLKSFSDEFYRKRCGARLAPVLETIEWLKDHYVWLELTTMIIPGENDSEKEMLDIAEFIADLDQEIPWHISRFHPVYRMADHVPTPTATLIRAREIGHQAGLKHVYIGNAPEIEDNGTTRCPECRNSVILRNPALFRFENYLRDGQCPECWRALRGIWNVNQIIARRPS